MRRDFSAGVVLLRNIIEDGIKENEFRRVDPSMVTVTIYQIIEGAALFWSLGIEINFEKQVRGGINLVLDGIKVHR